VFAGGGAEDHNDRSKLREQNALRSKKFSLTVTIKVGITYLIIDY